MDGENTPETGGCEEIQASGDAIIIAQAINNLADAIREHTNSLMQGEDAPETSAYDLSGERLA